MNITEKTIRRFWSKVERHNEDKCWIWCAGKRHGYGIFSVNHDTTVLAHRFSYFIHNRSLDPKKNVNHKPSCNNCACVNPNHLYQGTQADNIWDRVEAGTSKRARRKPALSSEEIKEIYIQYKRVRPDLSRRAPPGFTVRFAEQYNVSEATISRVIKKCMISKRPDAS